MSGCELRLTVLAAYGVLDRIQHQKRMEGTILENIYQAFYSKTGLIRA